MAKERLDLALVARGLCDSREQARRLILAGEVKVKGHVCDKASTGVEATTEIEIRERPRFVSRGGLKLEGALEAFGIDPAGRVCLDIGASTGGFTDCLLQRGAERVYAFDVGTNQLAWKIRDDPRVVARERFNVRHMVPADLGEPIGLVVIDVSFISLTRILGPAFSVLDGGGAVICLIKPQFELRREDIGKGGIVRDPALHERAVDKIRDYVTVDLAKEWRGHIDSPITGTDGNREFLAWLTFPHA
jgi:23S rRNA (cytidine1920-2'-O)/16S rRNA (cytidine1409-2'-O)-methyltransferase